METTIAERFKILIKNLGKTNNSFGISIGKNASTINYIVDGKSRPGFDVLDAIFATYPDVNPTWLMTGKGDIRLTQKSSVNTGGDLVDRVEQYISGKYEQLLEQKNNVIAEQRFMLDFLKGQLGKLSGVIEWAQVLPLWEENKATA